MATKSKAYRAAAEKIAADTYFTHSEAVALAKETGSKKFDSTVEVALKLSVDPRKADQMVRGTVILPHGTGKTARVIVFATGPAAEAAIAAGADEVGGAELIERVAGGCGHRHDTRDSRGCRRLRRRRSSREPKRRRRAQTRTPSIGGRCVEPYVAREPLQTRRAHRQP